MNPHLSVHNSSMLPAVNSQPSVSATSGQFQSPSPALGSSQGPVAVTTAARTPGKQAQTVSANDESSSVKRVIERARKYIAKCPPAISGQGGHNATFRVAAALVHGFALSNDDALIELQVWNKSCEPPWSEGELQHKIASAQSATTHRKPRGHLLRLKSQPTAQAFPLPRAVGVTQPSRPTFDPETLKRIAVKTSEIKDVVPFISDRSPVQVATQDSARVLRHLYPPGSGEKILLFSNMKSQGQFLWNADSGDTIQNHHLPAGDDGVWFLPQPVTGQFHANPRLGGKHSRRSEEAVTSWRYAVLESDEADVDDWLRCLVQVPLRIACICESGGRSIHALVRVEAASKGDWDGRIGAIKPLLITLGADLGALSAVRLSRLPQAKRGERVQRLLYLNAQPNGLPILHQPTQKALYGREWNVEGTPDE